MKTFKHIMLCALATIVGSPAAAFLIYFIIDMFIWLEALAIHITSNLSFFGSLQRTYTDIGWIVIATAIAKFLIPFYGAAEIVKFGKGNKFTWPPAVSFFLFSMICAIHNVYWYMKL